MKVLFFNYEYPPLGGGAANATQYILKEYAQVFGLEVDLVTSSVDKSYHLETVGEKIRIHKLPIGKNAANFHFQSQKDLLFYAFRAYLFSKKLIRKSLDDNAPYDITHSFFTVPCGFISLIIKKKFKIPYIVSLRGSDVPGYSERFSGLYKIISPLIRKIWKEASFVVSNSEGLRELALKTNSNQKIGVIFNGVNINEFRPGERNCTADRFKIICVSRITPRKGIGYLIDAMAMLVKKYFFVELEIVGDGDQRKELGEKVIGMGIEKNVKFLGLMKHDAVAEYYSNADAFVLPSLNEGMSNTMLEALAAGLPIVATNTGGTKELVKNGENGFIAETKNAKDLAEKIGKIIKDREMCQRMGRESRRRAEQMSWKNVAKEYLELYKKC